MKMWCPAALARSASFAAQVLAAAAASYKRLFSQSARAGVPIVIKRRK